MKQVNLYIALILVMLIMSPSNIMVAQNNNLLFYEPLPSLSLDSINSLLLLQSYTKEYEREDTLVHYYNDSEGVEIELGYCPKSRSIYSFCYSYYFNSETMDDFTPKSLNLSEFHSDETYAIERYGDSLRYLSNKKYVFYKAYFLNVIDYLKQKHGNPTSFVYDNKLDMPIEFKGNRLDTLNSHFFMKGDCNITVVWNNKKRKITLSYSITGISNIVYEYLNYANQEKMKNELASLKQQEEKKEIYNRIIIGTIILLLVFIIIWFTYKLIKLNQEKRREEEAEANSQNQIRIREKLEKWKQEEEELKKLEEDHKQYISSLVEKYGNCDKNIKIGCKHQYSFDEILVFGQTKHVVIRRREYNFSDILDCVVNDNIKEIETIETYSDDSIATSKTDTGSLIGRSVVGGILAGGVGAIIGGGTAKRQTVVEYGTDTSIHNKEMEHNYTIAITIKDIAAPVMYLNVGNDIKLKDEIVSLMKVIISMR